MLKIWYKVLGYKDEEARFMAWFARKELKKKIRRWLNELHGYL